MKNKILNIKELDKLSDLDSNKRIKEAQKRVRGGVYSSDIILEDLVDKFMDIFSERL